MIDVFIRNRKLLFLFYVLVSIGLRLFSFFPSVLDHDESTYLIIGRDILNGKDLYTDVTDTKPVGIFLFYAGLEFIFGSSIFWKRLVFAIVVGATAYLISLVSQKIFRQNKVAFISGIIYIIYVSIWIYHGRSPNTELLFNLTTIGSLLLFLQPRIGNYFLGGLLMGIGFIIKYLVLFDFAAFLLFFFIYEMVQAETRWKRIVWIRFISAGFAFLIPFALTNLYFWLGPHFQDFYYITYELPGNYGSSPSFLRYGTMFLDFTAKFLPISFLVFYVVFKRKKPWDNKYSWFFLMWISSVFVAMYVPGKEFSHYTIQLMLPFSLVAGLFFHEDFERKRIPGIIFSRKIGLPLLGIFILVIQIISFQNEILKPDYELEVADYISEKMNKNDEVYVSNYQQIVYYLLKIESPSKYVHSNLMFTSNQKAFNVIGEDEIKRIISKKPRFVLIQQNNKMVEKLIEQDYHKLKDFKNSRIKLYELIP